ncbi:MAG: hypothetical protein JWO62_1152 [Acidimicrobiaceae bacterium]|nr:hypothetical protein [Acidimicrobiaceae bacterium]
MKRRIAGKFGRKPGVSDAGSQFPLRSYLVDPLPLHPDPDDFTSAVAQWGMLGNDTYGACGPCGDVHLNMANAWTAAEQTPGDIADPRWPTTAQVEAAYFAFGISMGEPGPQPDSGVDLGQWLLWRMKNSIGPIPPIGGFAQVDNGGDEYAAALHAFGGLFTGQMISPEAQQEYEAGQPFTSTATDWVGGHCTAHLARNATWGRLITWGSDQLFSWPWWQAAREEAYVIFTPEQMAAPGGVFNGVNVAQLKADISALNGTL